MKKWLYFIKNKLPFVYKIVKTYYYLKERCEVINWGPVCAEYITGSAYGTDSGCNHRYLDQTYCFAHGILLPIAK